MSRDEVLFQGRIESWIVGVLDSHDDDSFGRLVADLPGVDPSIAFATLQGMTAGNGALGQRATLLLDDCRAKQATSATTISRPIPHPLDYFWAYSPGSIEKIVDAMRAATFPGSRMAYLGTPNAFDVCAGAMPDRSHILLDRRDFGGVARAGQNRGFEQVDLLQGEVPLLDAQAAILDPPWYPDDMRAFLWAAAMATSDGGQIWMSSPPFGTRPKAEREVGEVVEWAREAGLDLEEKLPRAIRYLSPPFELASHRAAELGGVPLDWRTGDLLRFRRRSSIDASRPAAGADEGLWRSLELDEIPIWVKDRPPASGPIAEGLLRSVVSGDVLQTVSRRNPARQDVDLWTSLNRVWASSHPAVLEAICESSFKGTDVGQAVEGRLDRTLSTLEREHVRTATDHLLDTVRREREEHGM